MKEASTDKLRRHHFLIENAGKDVSIEQMLGQMYYNDFIEKGAQIGKIDGNEQLLKKNKRFLGISNEGRRNNGHHYVVLLTFKQKGIKNPNNRSQL